MNIKTQNLSAAPAREEMPSYEQEALWLAHQTTSMGASYTIPNLFRLEGELDVSALEKALNSLVLTHDSLRTFFSFEHGQLQRRISDFERFDLPVVSADVCTDEGQIFRDVFQKPISMEQFPLWRMLLIVKNPLEHLLLFPVHHAVSDGASSETLLRQLIMTYQSFIDTDRAPVGSCFQYGDYVRYQRAEQKLGQFERSTAFWSKTLSGAPPAHQLFMDGSRSSQVSAVGEKFYLNFPADLLAQISAVAKAYRVTPFAVLVTSFSLVLQRLSCAEMVVGVPFSTRTQEHMENAVGFFVNLLPFYLSMQPSAGFATHLKQAQALLFDMHDHREVPLSQIVSSLNPSRLPHASPLFQITFSYDAAPLYVESHGLRGVLESGDTGASQFDFGVVFEGGMRPRVGVQYAKELFTRRGIEVWVAAWVEFLKGCVTNPDTPVEHIALCHAPARIITDKDASADSIAQQFHHIAEKFPDAVALRSIDATTITYAKLSTRAYVIADSLQDLGIMPGATVGVCFDPGIPLLESVLGILSHHCAFIPIAPDVPEKRIEHILRDSRVDLVIAADCYAEKFADVSVQVYENLPMTGRGQKSVPRAYSPALLAYTLFTSGSSGAPRGVQISNRSVSHLIQAVQNIYPLEPGDVVLQTSSLTFDVSIWEIFGALLNGVTVAVLPRAVQIDPVQILESGRLLQGSVLQVVPSFLEQFLDRPGTDDSAWRPKYLFCAGERFVWKVAERALAKWGGHTKIVNLYGPTETCVYALTEHFEATFERMMSVPIGHALPRMESLVLDRHLAPVPANVAGELYIAGDGLARGYARRPKETAERFVPDHTAVRPGERLYRTGDLVRTLPDGRIEFLRRIDRQVKRNGVRIELSEIENILTRHPEVKQVAAVWNDDPAQIVAFVRVETPENVTDFQSYLGQYLAPYMMPDRVMVVDEFPTSLHGKIDYRELASIGSQKANDEPRPPRDRFELELSVIWEQILRCPVTDMSANFFEMGGNSLQAVKVAHLVETRLGCKLELSSLIQAQTIESLAVLLRAKPNQRTSPLVAMQPEGERTPFFCVHSLGGSVLGYIPLAKRFGRDRPFYALEYLSTLENRPESIEAMAQTYVAAIRTKQPKGPYLLGGYSLGGVVAFEMARLLLSEGEKIAILAILDTAAGGKEPEILDNRHEMISKEAVASEVIATMQDRYPEVLELLEKDPEEMMNAGLAFARDKGVVPPDFGLLQVERLVDAWRICAESLANYQCNYFAGQIDLFLTPSEQTTVDMNWCPHAQAVREHLITGDHHSILLEPDVDELARALRAAIDEADCE